MLVLLCSSLLVIVATLIGGLVFDAGFIMYFIVCYCFHSNWGFCV